MYRMDGEEQGGEKCGVRRPRHQMIAKQKVEQDTGQCVQPDVIEVADLRAIVLTVYFIINAILVDVLVPVTFEIIVEIPAISAFVRLTLLVSVLIRESVVFEVGYISIATRVAAGNRAVVED